MSDTERLTVDTLLSHLDARVARGRRAELLGHVAAALEPVFSLVIDAGGRTKEGEGERTFAISHLLARSVTDLVAAAHLSSHVYLQQAYTLIRPVHEHCDLIELFVQEPEEAARWVNADKPGHDYRPAQVRKRIGSDPVDAWTYGHLSEMGSHPRFAGSRLSGVMTVNRTDPADRRLVLRMGSFYEWHPAAVHVYMFIFDACIRVGFKARHLQTVSDRLDRARWLAAYVTCVREASAGCKVIRAELLDMEAGEDTEFLDTVYDDLVAAVGPEDG
jgi:hypothetical protein